MAKSNPRLAQIPTVNPKYIWGSGVFNTPIGYKCNSSTLLLQSVGYTKMEDGTALRINLDFLIRLTSSNHNTQACTAWYIHVSSHLLMQAAFS